MSSHTQRPQCVVRIVENAERHVSLMMSNGIEAILSDSKKKYNEKVNALLAAWEYVTNYLGNCIANAHESLSLIEWVNKYTLELVLRGEWPKLAPATKTHLSVTLQKCATQLVQQQHPAARRCQALIELVKDPWGKPALDKILNGQLGSEHEEEEFCCQEKGELLEMRLKTLCEDRCEDIAVNLAAACVRSLRRNDRLRSLSESGQVHYMIDVYIVLLYKLKRTHDIVAQLKLMDLADGLELMQRLSGEKPTKYGTARVWRNSSKAAELVAQYLVTTGMVRPLVDVSAATLEQILNSWALLHAKSKDAVATLPGIIRKLIEPAESAQHIYIFGEVLVRHFGEALKPLVIELYIRALTTDMNELENQKSKSNKEKVQETAKRLSQEFLKLADYVNDSVWIARECVLTAFSLHPTRACYDRIRELAVACGKIKPDDTVTVKTEAAEDEEQQQQQQQEEGEPKNAVVAVDGEKEAAADTVKQETVADDITDENSKCHSPEKPKVLTSDGDQDKPPTNGSDKKPEPEDKRDSTQESQTTESSQLEALILIKGDAVTGSANYDEKAVPDQVLDGEKLGISPQLCDDLAVVLSSQRYHVLTWWLDWKELSDLCERYLENAEEMRNTNKELKYLNIDYSQFKDHPYEDDPRDSPFYGIEKGYEQWDDSDYSESDTYQQSLKTTARRSLDESSDTDSENVVKQPVKRGRPRKVPRLESSESEYDRKPRPRFRKALLISSSESDTNTQDSRASSLGSDGFRGKDTKRPAKAKRPTAATTTTTCNGAKKPVVRRRGSAKRKLTVDSVSHFHMLVNENERPCTGDDNSNNDIMTLFSADMDEKRETIKGAAAFNAAQLIITEKRSDPQVIKSLRMFRPHGKKLSQINNEKSVPSPSVTAITSPGKKKENNNIVAENGTNGMPTKFAPMLSTLNLNPKIALRRVDEIDKKIVAQQKKQVVSPGDLSNELKNIQKTIPFSNNKNSLTNFQKQKKLSKPRKSISPKTMKSDLAKSKLQEILTKSVPGMRTMEFSVPPRVQSTVHVVQLTRNIPQSPNSTASGNTPPRSRSNIQLPGTPSSGGHDSGVGMSPAGQTPPPPTRSSSLQDVAEEANQPPDTSPGLDATNASTMDSTDGTRTVALAVLANQRIGSGQSPKKSPSPSTNSTGDQHQQQQQPQQQQQQQLFLRKPDGTYHLVSPSVVTGQRSILSVQNFEDGNIGFARQVSVASVANTEAKTSQAQTGRNAGLPKFQQAFGKTICTLSTENTTLPSSSAETHAPAAPSGAATNVRGSAKSANSPNISKSVQTSVQNASIASLPNLQVSPGARQILNLVQSAVTSASTANAAATAGSGGQALQLCSVPNSTPGVIYTHKIAGANPTAQLISLPGIANNRSNVVSLGVVKSGLKVNIIRPMRTSTGTIQVVTSRIQQQQQQQPQQQAQQQQHQQQQSQQQQTQQSQQQQQQQQQTVRAADPLMNSTMDMATNQVSSSTLEQLREFESVLEQVKERSTSQSSATDTTTVQTQTQTTAPVKQPQSQQVNVSSLTQQLLMSSQSPSSALEFPSNGNTVTFQQQEVYPQKVALMYTNQNSSTATSKVVNSTPVVVVTSYCQPAASPALSVTSQSSSSPCVTPAPTPVSSTGKTQPQSTLKTTKKAAPKTVKQVSAQSAAKTAPIPKPQQKPQEDPETTQRIYAILGQYAEQLRNSPDLNNKPAPRRRSNPPTNPNQSSKRKKSGSGKSKTPSGQQTSEPSPSADDAGRTMGSSEDSSGGGGGAGSGTSNTAATLMHVQDSPAGFSASEETLPSSNNNSQGAVNDNATLGNVSETRTASTTSDSNDGVESNVKRRNLIFTEPNTGQARAVIVQEALQPTSVGEALASVTGKMATGTAVLVSDSTQQLNHSIKQESPVPSLTPRTTSTSSSSLDTATTQFLVSGGPSSSDSQESVTSTIQSSAMESSMDGVKIENGVLCGNARLQEAWEPERKCSPDTPWRMPSTTSPSMDQLKVYSRDGESSETVHNSALQIISKGQGIELSSSGGVFQTKKYYHTMNNSIDTFHKYPTKGLTNKSSQPNHARIAAEQESQQRLNERKQQLIERELTLQKSLSEECEDLGVEEPSANELFPEADLFFDTNHSPSFDHSSQEASCSQTLSGTTSISGLKSYGGSSVAGSFFKLDSVTSVSRDDSLVTTVQALEPKKKAPQQRRPAKPKETQARRNKRTSDGLLTADSGNVSEPKQLRLHLVDNLSQDDASNSNSDLSRLSSTTENEALKDSSNQKAINRNGSKDREGTPSSSRSSMHSQVKLELDAGSPANLVSTQSEVVRRVIDVNNISSITSSGEDDESLTLLDDSTANVAMPSPLSPIGGSLLTARYTYTNNKKKTPTTTAIKQPRASDFFRTTSLSWESPISERTRSSSDEEEEDNDEENEGDESSMGEVFGTSQLEGGDVTTIGNGLQEVIRNVPSVKVTPVDHATYSAKKKPPGVRRPAVNHKDSTIGVSPGALNKSADAKAVVAVNANAATKKLKTATGSLAVSSTSENETPSPTALADKLYEVIPSDDEARASTPTASTGPGAEHCSTARRSSLRGHVKKNCPCCIGTSPEPRKPKKVAPPKPQAQADSNGKIKRPSKQQQQQQQQQQQHQQQTKQPGKKR